jgi:polar amino acid transport system substrate-binding protein
MALQKGKVAAVTADESILVALLATAPDRYRFEISPFRVSDDPYGLGMRNGNPEFVRFVNSTLLEMEQNGEAKRIFNKWFGPKHEISMNRGTFRITVGR